MVLFWGAGARIREASAAALACRTVHGPQLNTQLSTQHSETNTSTSMTHITRITHRWPLLHAASRVSRPWVLSWTPRHGA